MTWHKFTKSESCVFGAFVILIFAVIAVFASLLAPYAYDAIDLSKRLHPLSIDNWMGTDEVGRDIFSRVLFGTRYAFLIVFQIICLVVPIGLSVGLIAGYCGGLIEKVLMRITDIFLAMPRLILALALVVMLGVGLKNAIIAIALTAWGPYARLVRAQTVVIKTANFITALRLQGVGHARMLCKFILPLTLNSVLVQLSLDISGFILSAAGLGFLGLGAQPPTPEWGAMIASGRQYLLNNWWVITFPGLAIAALSLGFNLFGEGLRDVLDSK